jgi:hypothetical protein
LGNIVLEDDPGVTKRLVPLPTGHSYFIYGVYFRGLLKPIHWFFPVASPNSQVMMFGPHQYTSVFLLKNVHDPQKDYQYSVKDPASCLSIAATESPSLNLDAAMFRSCSNGLLFGIILLFIMLMVILKPVLWRLMNILVILRNYLLSYLFVMLNISLVVLNFLLYQLSWLLL